MVYKWVRFSLWQLILIINNMNNNEYFFNVHTSISIKNTINELNQYLNGNITKTILKKLY